MASDEHPGLLEKLDEDLLASVAANCDTSTDLCCLASSCKTFARLILQDAQSMAIVWEPLISQLIDSSLVPSPSALLFRALSTVDELEWQRARLTVSRASAAEIMCRLNGRTGSAACRIGDDILLFGGTLNGNAGPLLGDLLHLDYDAEGQTLNVWPASAGGDAPEPCRGHSLSATTRDAGGAPVACQLGGWTDMGVAPMAPTLLSAADAAWARGRREVTVGRRSCKRRGGEPMEVVRCWG